MKNVITIMQRELRSYFGSTIAYTVTAFFLFVSGMLFLVPLAHDSSLRPFLGNTTVVLLLIVPAMTMRLIAEERRSGTIELLMTAPVTDAQVILGKYLGALVLYLAMMLCTLQYPIILMKVSTPDKGPMLSGYLGLFLLGALYLAVGLVASTLTKNQIVAAIGGFATLLSLWLISWMGTSGSSSFISEVLRQLSFIWRYENFAKGLIDTRDILYFVSLIGFCLLLSVRALAAVKSK